MTDTLLIAEMTTLYEKQFSRQQVANELQVSLRTLSRYLVFAAQYIPDLTIYLDAYGYLNRKRLESSHIEYLKEVQRLLNTYDKERVKAILTLKYSPIEND
jgi:predicted DNA-binding transcriptional regulator YafY